VSSQSCAAAYRARGGVQYTGCVNQLCIASGVLLVNIVGLPVINHHHYWKVCKNASCCDESFSILEPHGVDEHELMRCAVCPLWSGGSQILMLLSLVFVAIQVVVIGIFSVETPRWLINHNRVDDARAALVRLRGPDTDVDAELNTLLNEGGSQKSSQSNNTGTKTTTALLDT